MFTICEVPKKMKKCHLIRLFACSTFRMSKMSMKERTGSTMCLFHAAGVPKALLTHDDLDKERKEGKTMLTSQKTNYIYICIHTHIFKD